MLVKGTILVIGAGDDAAEIQADEKNKEVIFKNCAPFRECINNKIYTDRYNANDIDVAILMYNLIEYSDNCLEAPGCLWEYHRSELNDDINNFWKFEFKANISRKTPAIEDTKNDDIVVRLKYLNYFCRTLEVSQINCEMNLMPSWRADTVISSATGGTTIAVTDTKLYVPIVILTTQDNAKLLQQSKSDFKRTINQIKYQTLSWC